MNKLLVLTFFCMTVALFGGRPVSLQPLQQGDFGVNQVVRSVAGPAMDAERQPVSMSWAIDGDLEFAAKPHLAESKSFRMVVDASAFNDGITFGISAPGALVRINPMPGSGDATSAVHPLDLVLVNEAGQTFSRGSGMEALLDGLQTKDGNPFPAGTSAFRIGADLGAGLVSLYADNMNYASGVTYVINVLEKDSALVLGVQTGNDTYVTGQSIAVNAFLQGSRGPVAAEGLEGRIIAPDGQSFPLSFDGKSKAAQFPIGLAVSGQSGLWQVHVTAYALNDGVVVQRDAQTAIAVVSPTARFTGTANVNQGFTGLEAGLNVEVGVAGRFEVRGILMGTNSAGQMVPLAVGHSANWLNPGQGLLTLSFDQNLISESGLKAPFAINDLRLIHQDRMSLVHRQANGLRID